MVNNQVRTATFISLFLSLIYFSFAEAQENLPELIKKVQPSVVMICTYDVNDSIKLLGTGFFVSKNGYVVSNNHVFEGANKAIIKTLDGKIYPVTKVLAVDLIGDLILVSTDIQQESVNPLKISSTLPNIGEKIIVIGNPAGYEQSVSDGIVSAVREIPGCGNVIQITAPISHGSSGSPVVNLKGEVIGVATIVVTEGQNLNFAVSGKRVERLKQIDMNLTDQKIDSSDFLTTSAEKISSSTFTDLKDLLSLGKQKLSVSQYKEAVDLFSQVLTKDNRCVAAYYYRARANKEIGQYNNALTDVNCAISVNPNLAYSYKLRGEINSAEYNDNNDFGRAITDYSKAIEIDPSDYETYFGRATTYNLLGRYDNAITDFGLSLRYAPNKEKGGIYRKRSATYLSANRVTEALNDATKAIDFLIKYPSFSSDGEDFLKIAYKERAAIYDDKLNDFFKAIQDYKQVIHYMEANKTLAEEIRKIEVAGIENSIALAFSRWGMVDSSIKYLTKLIIYENQKLSSSDSNLINTGRYLIDLYELRAKNYAKIGRLKIAVDDYTTLIKNATYCFDSLVSIRSYLHARGDLLFTLGRYDDALKDFESIPYYSKMCMVYEKAHRDSDIIALCNRLLAEMTTPKNTILYREDCALLLYCRGKAQYRQKKKSYAVEDLNTYVTLQKDLLKILYEKKDIDEANNRIKEAELLVASIRK